MKDIFQIQGTDLRKEYIDAFDAKEPFITQKPSGKDVEFFSQETGFVLLRKDTEVNWNLPRSARARSVAELSLGPSLVLREFYYTLRGKPKLIQPFEGRKGIYGAVLASINNTEILCDIDRAKFTTGNLPKGFVHYGHNWQYADPEKPIGFTENLARTVLSDSDITNAQNIVHLEKAAAATRLVTTGFSKLTNSVLTTTGGNYTRAVYALFKRFHEKKEMTSFCDGDAYGNDMNRSLEYGTMESRHLTPDQAFPERLNPKVHVAGLFPSVCERIGLPNDVEAKRPMDNKEVRKRLEFQERHGTLDERDLATFKRNKTYELEALSSSYTNPKGEPIGLPIYLTEFFRIKEIPCKPQPTDNDEELVDRFRRQAKWNFKQDVESALNMDSPEYALKDLIQTKVEEIIDRIKDEIIDEHLDLLMKKADKVMAKQIREKLLHQYQKNPYREIFSLSEVVNELTDKLNITVEWEPKELMKKVEDALEDYVYDREGDIYTDEIEFQDLPEPEEELRPFYDIVEEAIGAKPEDCEKVREALEWRLS